MYFQVCSSITDYRLPNHFYPLHNLGKCTETQEFKAFQAAFTEPIGIPAESIGNPAPGPLGPIASLKQDGLF